MVVVGIAVYYLTEKCSGFTYVPAINSHVNLSIIRQFALISYLDYYFNEESMDISIR